MSMVWPRPSASLIELFSMDTPRLRSRRAIAVFQIVRCRACPMDSQHVSWRLSARVNACGPLGFDECARVPVDSHDADPLASEVLVDRSPLPAPPPVIVDDHNPPTGDPWVERFQFDLCRVVGICVQSEDCNPYSRKALARVQHVPFDNVHQVRAPSHGPDVGLGHLTLRLGVLDREAKFLTVEVDIEFGATHEP